MKEKSMPRNCNAMKLIGNLCEMRMKDPGVHFSLKTVGAHTSLYKTWWKFPDSVEEYRIFGVVPGVTIDGKEI